MFIHKSVITIHCLFIYTNSNIQNINLTILQWWLITHKYSVLQNNTSQLPYLPHPPQYFVTFFQHLIFFNKKVLLNIKNITLSLLQHMILLTLFFYRLSFSGLSLHSKLVYPTLYLCLSSKFLMKKVHLKIQTSFISLHLNYYSES